MCSLDSQISPASKNCAPIHHESAKSLKVRSAVLSLPIVMGVECVFWGKIFGKLSVLSNLAACAQVSRRLRVVGSTRTFNIRSSHWLIPNTAHAQSGDNLRLGRAMSYLPKSWYKIIEVMCATYCRFVWRKIIAVIYSSFAVAKKKPEKHFWWSRHSRVNYSLSCSISLRRSRRSSL